MAELLKCNQSIQIIIGHQTQAPKWKISFAGLTNIQIASGIQDLAFHGAYGMNTSKQMIKIFVYLAKCVGVEISKFRMENIIKQNQLLNVEIKQKILIISFD